MATRRCTGPPQVVETGGSSRGSWLLARTRGRRATTGELLWHSALRFSAVRGVVTALLQGGGAENLTPLQLAALEGDATAVTLLLAEGADPNAVDAYGWSSLHFAAPLAGSGVVSALLEAEADPNALTVGGLTALHLAARQGTSEVVSELLGTGADPNAGAGWEEEAGTPLHLAARWNDDSSVVLALLSGGADAAAKDENGRRPVDYARGNDAMIGSAAYPRLLVTRSTALVAGRAATGNLQPSDGVGEFLGYYDEWTYSAVAGPARRDHHGLGRRGRLPDGVGGRRNRSCERRRRRNRLQRSRGIPGTRD